MKVHIKNLFPAFLMAMVGSFMLLIYEPLLMFATNIDDFWFDIYMMLKPNVLFATIFFGGMCVGYSMIYAINRHFSKKLYIYKGVVLCTFIAFLVLYFHGNFLISNLPPMDGTEINWSSYAREDIISCVVTASIAISVIIITYKIKYNKAIKIYIFVTSMIFFMLATSLVTVILGKDIWKQKDLICVSTTDNINRISDDTNFIILLIDAVDSLKFKETLDNSVHSDMLNDFSYYPDTTSVYRFTRDTIPFIFSNGVLNKNETDFETYYNTSFNNSKIIRNLEERGYSINIYEPSFEWNDEKNQIVDNARNIEKKVNKLQYIKEIAKYDLFKYLPYPLKRFSHIERMDFENCKIVDCAESFSWDDRDYYEIIRNNELEKIEKKYFSFIHVEGAHVPFNYDENLNDVTGKGNYEDKIKASITIIDKYLERLKNAGAYDNSAIIIMADHGYDYTEGVSRLNPVFFVKGIGERHDDLITSDKPVSYTDLNEIYDGLLNGKKSDELLENIDYSRKRIILWYEFNDENHMVEYEQTGQAWDENTLVKTGNEYNR